VLKFKEFHDKDVNTDMKILYSKLDYPYINYKLKIPINLSDDNSTSLTALKYKDMRTMSALLNAYNNKDYGVTDIDKQTREGTMFNEIKKFLELVEINIKQHVKNENNLLCSVTDCVGKDKSLPNNDKTIEISKYNGIVFVSCDIKISLELTEDHINA
jgi:hypothetical protein